MITSHAHGINAPHMGPRDVGALLIGAVVPGMHDTAPAVTKLLCDAPLDLVTWNADLDPSRQRNVARRDPEFPDHLPWPLCDLGPDHGALDALAALLPLDGTQGRGIEWVELIFVSAAYTVTLRGVTDAMVFDATYLAPSPEGGDYVRNAVTIGSYTLERIEEAFVAENDRGTKA